MEEYIIDNFNLVRMNIKKYRKEHNLTQEQLAEKTELSTDYIQQIESPTKNKRFSLNTLICIAYCLKVPLYNFFKE